MKNKTNAQHGLSPSSLFFESCYYVYILLCANGKYYTGYTKNLKDRLDRHRRGSVPSTKNCRPLRLVNYSVFDDMYKAMAFEKYLKSGSGRAFANKRLR